MRYAIKHRTLYNFGTAIFLEPHVLRFRPRTDPGQFVEAFSLSIDPEPEGLSHGIDLSGNAFALAWFGALTSTLTIEACATVTTSRANAFDYLILPGGLDPLPWSISTPIAMPYLQRTGVPSGDPVATYARDLASEAQTAVAFLGTLTDALFDSTQVIIREEGEPNPPAETLATRVGSCRDLTVLFTDCCRVVGIPARFVSGYQEGDPDQDRRDLHAWAEAWIPGAGWRGYDPTLGLVVTDRHIPVAAAPDAASAAPVQGSFRGSAASMKLSFEIEVEELT